MINDSFSLKGFGFSNAVDNSNLPRHRWYGFKEAFSPNIVDAAIRSANLKRTGPIIDPFSGSGTVALVAAQKGFRAIGVEVNPFFAFMSRTKLIDYPADDFLRHATMIERAARDGAVSPLEDYSTFSVASGKEKYLFNRSVLRSFEGGWQESEELPTDARNLMQLALINAAMANCNAYKDGKCLRYYKDWRERDYGTPSFLKSLGNVIEAIQQDLQISRIDPTASLIKNGDARQYIDHLQDIEFDLCVTSPPYLNSFDYTDVYRPELFLGRFVNSSEELRQLRFKTIRSHVQVKHEVNDKVAFGSIFEDVIEKIMDRQQYLWNSNLPTMISSYFIDMEGVLRKLRSKASKGASAWMIVSTSAYAGVEIPVDLILAHIASRCGWRLKEVGVLRNLRTSGQNWNRWSTDRDERKPHLRESVVILQAD